MPDILRGEVAKIIDGDTFELKVQQVDADDRERYDAVERIKIASLDDEIESRTTELEEAAEVDEDETTGTPEEASIQTGAVDPTRFFGRRDKEDLESLILGKAVRCVVRERNRGESLVAEVSLI